jgi:TPR repeat protein
MKKPYTTHFKMSDFERRNFFPLWHNTSPAMVTPLTRRNVPRTDKSARSNSIFRIVLCMLSALCLAPLLACALPDAQHVKVASTLTVKQIVETKTQAKAGNAYSQGMLARKYLFGQIKKLPNYNKALYWSRQAIQKNDPVAHYNLALLYDIGAGVQQNKALYVQHATSAFKHAQKSLSSSHHQERMMANYILGTLYFWGIPGIQKQNFDLSFTHYMRAANEGDLTAMRCVAFMYYYGLGTPQNLKKAFEWTQFLAQLGLGDEQYALGNLYQKGEGVKANPDKATYWLNRAARSGSLQAMREMVSLAAKGKLNMSTLKRSSWWSLYGKMQVANLASMKHHGNPED